MRVPWATVEVPGVDYGLAVGDVDSVMDEVEEFLTGTRRVHERNRVLATVLVTDMVAATSRVVELGDARWRELLESHEELARRHVAGFGGVLTDFTGDGLLASFDGPARAVRCAVAVRNQLRPLGLELRAGLHTGDRTTR